MRKFIASTAILLAVAWAAVAAPAPPTGMGTSTNTPFADQTVITNVAVSMAAGSWANATIYAPAKSLKQGLQFTWTPSAGAVGYAFYYGDVTGTTTNRFDVLANNGVVFFNLNTNTVYFFYATAYAAARAESPPSNVVIAKPGS